MKIVKRLFFTFSLLAFSNYTIAQKTVEPRNQIEIYSPQIIVEKLPNAVEETSGLIFFRNAIWTLNDSGGEPQIYGLDSRSGKILQTIRIENATNIDFEELTQDDNYIYIGDFGNNLGNRTNLIIYKISKKEIPFNGDASLKAEFIYFRYADQENFEKKSRQTDFDCEAMISFEDKLYLFTKNWVDGNTRLYSVPKEAGNYSLALIAQFQADGLITAAHYRAENQTLVLLGYKDFMPFLWIFQDFDEDDFFEGKQRRIHLETIHGAQTEGVCFDKSGNLFVSCERSYFPQRLFKIPADFVYHDFESVSSTKPTETLQLNAHYEASNKTILLEIVGLSKGTYSIEILNEAWKSETKLTFTAQKEERQMVNLETGNLQKGLNYLRVEQKEKLKVIRVYLTN